VIASPLLSVFDAAELLGVSPDTVRRWIASGELPAFRHGRILRVPEAEFARFIAGHTSTPKAPPKPRARAAAPRTLPRPKPAAGSGGEPVDPMARLRELQAEQEGKG
jgi:excisionase family DNA binding protein